MFKNSLLSIYPLYYLYDNENFNNHKHTNENEKKLIIINGFTSQDLSFKYQNKCGILIAGNAGRPAGYIGEVDGSGLNPHANITKHYTTQEESIISSWLLAEKYIHKYNISDLNLLFRKNLGDRVNGGRPWGMKFPERSLKEKGSVYTIQGKDFTQPFFKNGEQKFNQAENYKFAYSLKNVPIINSLKDNIKYVDLIFCYGPNIAFNSKTLKGTGTRTKVHDYNYERDYNVFRECVKTAFRSGLIKMIENKDEIAILCPISGGIYSGKGSRTNKRINREYEDIINEIIMEKYKGKNIGYYFKQIILPKL